MKYKAKFTWYYGLQCFNDNREYATLLGYKRFLNRLKENPKFSSVMVTIRTEGGEMIGVAL